jgi:hypothetical protein
MGGGGSGNNFCHIKMSIGRQRGTKRPVKSCLCIIFYGPEGVCVLEGRGGPDNFFFTESVSLAFFMDKIFGRLPGYNKSIPTSTYFASTRIPYILFRF